MLVLYLNNNKASFQEQRFDFEGISSKHIDCSKAKNVNILAWRPKMIKLRPLYFLKLLKFQTIKYPYFLIFGL